MADVVIMREGSLGYASDFLHSLRSSANLRSFARSLRADRAWPPFLQFANTAGSRRWLETCSSIAVGAELSLQRSKQH